MSTAATPAPDRARSPGAGWRKRLDRFGDRGDVRDLPRRGAARRGRDHRDRLPGRPRRAAGDRQIRPRLHHRHRMEPEPNSSTSSVPARSSSAPCSAPSSRSSSAPRSRSRSASTSACWRRKRSAAWSRRWSNCSPRCPASSTASGGSCPRPVRQIDDRARPAQRARLHPALRHAGNDRLQRLHRGADPDDHDRADHLLGLARPLQRRSRADVQDGAAALGATRWEVVRGVVLPSTASGVVAASLLGLGRALGEAIAVSQVIGAGSEIHARPVQDRRHPRLADRQPVPRRADRAAQSLALLLRRDPAGDRGRLEPDRTVDRPSLQLRRRARCDERAPNQLGTEGGPAVLRSRRRR